jgi:hypothetical protein
VKKNGYVNTITILKGPLDCNFAFYSPTTCDTMKDQEGRRIKTDESFL